MPSPSAFGVDPAKCQEGAGVDAGWPVVEWTQAEHAVGQAWGLKAVATFQTHGTPFATDQAEIDRASLEGRAYVKAERDEKSE